MKKLVLYLTLFLVCVSAVFAANTLTLNFYDESGHAVDNVETSIFQCTNSSCEELIGASTSISTSDRIEYADSGSTNTAVLSIPSTSSETWYVAYMFAEESDSYLPRYYTFAFTGDNAELEHSITLEKGYDCKSTIQSFSVINAVEPDMPITVNVEAALEADTYSAFELTDDVYPYGMSYTYTDSDGIVHYYFNSYNNWYSAETQITLTITKEIGSFDVTVNTQSETLSIQAEDSENVAFTWTPTSEGTYTATVTTEVIDEQCATTEEQSESEEFTIVSEEDAGYCYTTIDNLRVEEIETGEVSTLHTGEEYTVIFDKISNAVADDGTLTALPTALDVAVYDDEANLDYAFSDTMDANTNTVTAEEYSFSWTPVSEGDNTIAVEGIATSCPYSTNNIENEALTIYVEGTDVDVNQPPVAEANGGILGYWSTDYDVTFDGSGSYDTDGYIVDYSWDFGDGTTGTGINPTHTYTDTDARTYTATLTVTDNEGATDDDTAAVIIYIFNWPELDPVPYASCGGPYTGIVNEDISFEGSTFDLEGDSLTLLWEFGDSATSTDEDPTHAYSAAGIYDVTFTVTDDDGNYDICSTTATITEEIPNEVPVPWCGDIPTTGTVGEELTFDGSESYDLDGYITDYAWYFDYTSHLEPADSTDAVATWIYDTAGTYTVALWVTDDAGEPEGCSADIEITESVEPTNENPVALCIIPSSLLVGEEGTFDGSTSYDTDGTIVNYAWDFGDGNTDTTSTTTYSYSAEGSYTASLTVTDDDGATDSCSGIVEVTTETTEEITVEIVANPVSGQEPLTVDFSEIITNGVEPYTYAWDLGDGSISIDAILTHVYTVGTYTVTLIVTDSTGETASDSETIIVSVTTDLPAVAVASANPTSGEPTLWVQFSSEGSSGDEPLSYYWTFGDGESSTRANPGHYYDEEGTYTAILTVTDADGDSDSDSVTITVGDELENIASRHYYVDGIAMSNDGRVQAGDTIELYIAAENIADVDKDSVAFNAIIQELGIYETTVEMNMDAGEREAVVLYIDIPADTEPGTYYVRITISDDYVKRVIYRDIIVTD